MNDMVDSLTIERLFSNPDLSGRVPLALKFSPDASRITWLMASSANYEQLDLWEFDIAAGQSRMLVDAGQLSQAEGQLSDEEKANRERKRISQSGIIEYRWHPDSKTLQFPLDGNLYLYDIATATLDQLTDSDTYETDSAFSPDGKYLSFIRNQDLYLTDLQDKHEIRLTFDGGATVSNGIAEFIAQEEMHRYEGYWWSPDSRWIAFCQVNDASVSLTQRYEIDADGMNAFDQRYPYAGTPNANVRLGVANLVGEITWLDLARDPESYLARVAWLADSRQLAVQTQSRDQQHLDLLVADRQSGEVRCLLSETSQTWLNLNNNFRALKNAPHLIWGSERDGFNHLYLLDAAGNVQTRLTSGQGPVADVAGIDEQAGIIYCDGYLDTPLERHLYAVPLDGSALPRRITAAGASHQVIVAPDNHCFIDRYSSATTPASVAVMAINGTAMYPISANTLTAAHPMFPYVNVCGEATFGELQADDGQRLRYRLIKPKRGTAARHPVIVTVYGGPGVQCVTNEWIPPWHHYMASQGYGLLQLDNRGSSNRGTRFEAPIYRQLGCAEVTDQLIGVDFLRSLDWVDEQRIGVFGHSYGGYMTLMLLMKAPGVFRCGISVAPVTDWRLYDTHYTERYLGDPATNADGYENSSVFPYAERLADPLLLIHGMADDNVLYTHSTKLYKVLQDAGVQFDIMAYPGSKHGLTGRKTNIHRYTLMDAFFNRHLGLST